MPTNPNGYGLEPGRYTAVRTPRKPALTGRADCEVWAAAPRTARFVDLTTGSPAPLDTSASVLWDDAALYIAFWAAEPAVAATFTERDSLLFYENDLEIFIDGGDTYYELEFNAIGTIYEAFYIWRDAWHPGGVWDTEQFAVHDPRVHSFGGDFERGPDTFWTGSHPRGTRWAYLNYDLPGLTVKVAVDGTANDPSVLDRGWSAEVEIPWSALTHLAHGRALPATPGDEWGIFLGRFQQLETRSPSTTAVAGWGASVIGVPDTHVPESFTRVRFSGDELAL
jgi:hypothetical protein